MSLKRLEKVVKESDVVAYGTKVLDHFLYVQLNNVNVLVFEAESKYSADYVCLYSISKDGKYAGQIKAPEMNMIPELRRLSKLTRAQVVKLIEDNREATE